MLIKFLTSGESPEIGSFAEGEERGIPDSIARIYISRKMAMEVLSEKPAPARAAVKKEDKDNG